MAVDAATTIAGFDLAKPAGSDQRAELDDGVRHVKTVLKSNFAYIGGTVTASHTELSHVAGVTSPIQTQLDTKGAKAGQVWTGAHDFSAATLSVATATLGDSSLKPASTAFVAATVFASALPAVSAATKDKVIGNDGVTASWRDTPLVTAESLFLATY